MKKIIAGTICLVMWASCAFAQNQTSSDDYRKFEFFAGYSANNLLNGNPENVEDVNSGSTPTYRGWNASAVYNFNRYLGVKADVSGHYKKFTVLETPARVRADADFYNFLAGIQLKDNKKSKRFSPFLHAMAGLNNSGVKVDLSNVSGVPALKESNTGFSMVFGGGLDLKVSNRFSIRLIKADYNPTFSGGSNRNNVRLGFGIVFH